MIKRQKIIKQNYYCKHVEYHINIINNQTEIFLRAGFVLPHYIIIRIFNP